MLSIRPAAPALAPWLSPPHCPDPAALRPSVFAVEAPCDRGLLLCHTLTGELLLLSEQESRARETDSALRAELARRLFLVPAGFDELRFCDQVKDVLRLLEPPAEHLTDYTVFTTTDCNARCFYCFEMGQRRYAMTAQTAEDVAAFMIRRSGGHPVSIRWFGGEPLLNPAVIDLISARLRDAGITVYATMVSNGYLFTPALVEKAKGLWQLRRVFITLDGTEPVYNRTKAYVAPEGSAFRRVLGNIEALLAAGVPVCVKLNMDRRNAADLVDLADMLIARFAAFPLLTVSVNMLIEYVGRINAFATEDEAVEAKTRLEEKLERAGLLHLEALPRKPRLRRCLADSDTGVTVLPDGRLGKCEHFGEDGCLGSVYDEARPEPVLSKWTETWPAVEACRSCARYPLCVRLKACGGVTEHCTDQSRRIWLDHFRRQMRRALQNAQKETQHEAET